MKHSWRLALAYGGAVIGAGFASGQEIVQFFVRYGAAGYQGALLALLLFVLAGVMVMSLSWRYGLHHYQELLTFLLGSRWGRLVDILLALFLFLGVSTMLSAAGAIFAEHFYRPPLQGILLTFGLVLLLLWRGYQGLMLAYRWLVPVKLLLLAAISAWAAFMLPAPAAAEASLVWLLAAPDGWWLAALLYVAYNFALAIVVLTEYRPPRPASGIGGAVLGGLLLGGLLLLHYLALSRFVPMVLHYEIPMLYVGGNISLTVKHIYCAVLWLGILTTALANAFGCAQRLALLLKLSYPFTLALCLLLSLPLALQSFGGLVGKIYPLFGLLGLLILSALFVQFTRRGWRALKKRVPPADRLLRRHC